jgi:signal transduction histidine kinase
MPAPLRVLIVEDNEDDALLLVRELGRGGYQPTFQRVQNAQELREALRESWDIILSDYSLPHFTALDALRILHEREMDIPFIAISGMVSETTILAALKAGAGDYLMKDNLTRLTAAVQRELRDAAGRRERRRLEEQLRQAQKMEAVGRLAGGVAHDFNNLLTVITGYSELLLSDASLKEAQRSAVEEVRRAAERGGALTHQLLAFSRRQPLTPKIVRLNELVLNMEKMLQRLIGEDVQLIHTQHPEAGAVKIDTGHLEQVIMNLAVNARDAMPQGGKLTIETGNVEVDAEFAVTHLDLKPGPYVALAISDTGVGMDAETLSHLFEPFFTTKSPGKGTGLGLATAYGIIKQSGGSIVISSEVGQGTTVRIYLPRVGEGAGTRPAATGASEAATGSETILVVEDEPRVRKLILDVLAVRGYRALEATCGEEALQVCGTHRGPIHLLLVDVVMPGMSGPEVARQVQAARPHIRTLFMSGYTEDAISQHGVTGSALLQKPFVPSALAQAVRLALDASSAAPA